MRRPYDTRGVSVRKFWADAMLPFPSDKGG